MLKKTYYSVKNFFLSYNENNVNTFAAAAAFFIFLSLIPILVLLISLIPFTPLTEANLLQFLLRLVPDSLEKFTTQIVNELYGNHKTLFSISIVATIWSAGKGILSIIRGFNAIYRVRETRNNFLLRIKACIYTVLFIIIIVIALVVFVFGNVLAANFLYKIYYYGSFLHIIIKFRLLYEWLFFALILSFLYAFMPNERLNLRAQLPGAVFSGISWTFFTWIFSAYIDKFDAFNMYGSLATIIILMLWLYIFMLILMTGAQINYFYKPEFDSLRKSKKTKRALRRQLRKQKHMK